MKKKILFKGCLTVFALVLFAYSGFSQTVRPVAKEAVSVRSPEEISRLKSLVEANPDSLNNHKAYIKAMGLLNPELIIQYDKWIKENPGNINFPLAIGQAFNQKELPQARKYLLEVVAIDPNNALTWSMLSDDAERWGQQTLANSYLEKAALAEPANVGYAYYYASSLQYSDPELYKQKILELTRRFPASERGAQGLYWLAEKSIDQSEKIKYYEMLKRLYPPDKFSWSADGMQELWAVYLEIDIQKALSLAISMGNAKFWTAQKLLTEQIINERELTENKDFNGAEAILDKVKLPRYPNVSDFYYNEQASLQAKQGNIKIAYDTLTMKYAKMPSDVIYKALINYGSKINKSEQDIKKDVATIRKANAIDAFPFNLEQYFISGRLKLEDLKGKVVLLTFWFPGCGPCRGEFPHFQHVINKYKDEPVFYVGINVSPQQDPYVIPFMNNTKYTFIPLHGTDDVIKGYNVQGEPENFLINQNGKIIFKGFSIHGENEAVLETMINSLLTDDN